MPPKYRGRFGSGSTAGGAIGSANAGQTGVERLEEVLDVNLPLPQVTSAPFGRIGPAFGYGLGCGAGLGIGLMGGLGLGWGVPGLRLGMGFGAGCGVGVGFGYGVGRGRAYDREGNHTNLHGGSSYLYARKLTPVTGRPRKADTPLASLAVGRMVHDLFHDIRTFFGSLTGTRPH
ncbi:unnamed protein product [Closterium sp. NIES-53]